MKKTSHSIKAHLTVLYVCLLYVCQSINLLVHLNHPPVMCALMQNF
jgi:hypothetical protein